MGTYSIVDSLLQKINVKPNGTSEERKEKKNSIAYYLIIRLHLPNISYLEIYLPNFHIHRPAKWFDYCRVIPTITLVK